MRRVFNLFIRHVSYVSERIPLYKQLNHFFFYLQIRNNHLNFRSFLLFLCLVLMIKHLHMLRNVFILFMIRDEGILLRKIWSIAVLLFQTMKLCFWYIFFSFQMRSWAETLWNSVWFFSNGNVLSSDLKEKREYLALK